MKEIVRAPIREGIFQKVIGHFLWSKNANSCYHRQIEVEAIHE